MLKSKVLIFILFALMVIVIPLSILLFPGDIKHHQDGQTTSSNFTIDDIKERGFKIYDKATEKVIHVSETDYIIGTVIAEIPAEFHTEAIKAQAVAAHTYAVVIREQNKLNKNEAIKGADFVADSKSFQGYISKERAKEMWGDKYDLYYKKISDAVLSVKGEIITYNNQPITAAYHAISCGKTEDSANVWSKQLPYLVSVDSSFDKLAKNYDSTAVFSLQEIKSLFNKEYKDITFDDLNAENWFTDIVKSDAGNVLSLKLNGTELKGTMVRSILNLRSSCFDISFKEGLFTFKVKGYGHSVGLSQNGADFLARQGKSYKEILSHYYTGTEIKKIN